ncbi:MAG TPA: tetratricopeptide repeat protein, partial [Candidatus Angelobacter sp.]|nr:tetratricopeptide repeat protein [Candidatus Angelobacter sp.]
ALAYVGLADCYNLLREYSVMSEAEAYPRAMAAARKAIELDDSLAEAHNSLAFGTFWWSWDAVNAEAEFRRALALNPNYVLAHHWYATFLLSVGRNREALDQIEIARQLDSGSASILADRALILYDAGRQDEAVALLNQISENEPTFLSPHRYLALIDLVNGRYSEYLAQARKVAELSQDKVQMAIVDAGEKAFRSGGAESVLPAVLQEQEKLYAEGRIQAYHLAQTYSLLGQNHEAMKYLGVAREHHESQLANVREDPTLAKLHADPSYREFLTSIGLPRTSGS